MQIISETLAQAAVSLRGRPAVWAEVRNRRLRWRERFRRHLGDNQNGALAPAAGGLLRARGGPGGQVLVAFVASPAHEDEWFTWRTARSDAIEYSEVALTLTRAGRLRLAYVRPDGGAYRVSVSESVDAGLTWGAAVDVVRGLGEPPYVAAADQTVFVYRGSLAAYRGAGASWSAPVPWGQTVSASAGLAALDDPAADRQRLIICGDGRVLTCTYDPAAGAYGPATNIHPGADQPPPPAQAPYDPAAVALPEGWLCSWVQYTAGSPDTVGQAVAAATSDWVHYGDAVPLEMDPSLPRRAALAYLPGTRQIYAADLNTVLAADVYHSAAAALNRGELAVRAYRRSAGNLRAGRLVVELLDPAGEVWAGGEAGSALAPLAEVAVARGYLTTAGPEAVRTPPHYLVALSRAAGQMTLEAVDALGLLALWRPREVLAWSGRSIGWLLDELCARAGLPAGGGWPAEMAAALPAFAVGPGHTGLAAAAALWRLAGCVARARVAGGIEALPWPPEEAEGAATVGARGEILEAGWSLARPAYTGVAVAGAGHAARGVHLAESMALGAWLQETVEDARIASAELAANVLRRELARGGGRAETVRLPLRPDLEPWDGVALYGAAGEGPFAAAALEERYDGPAGRYETVLTLEAVRG